MKTKTLNTILASAVALTIAGTANTATAMGPDENSEQCFGVVKAGANDCGAADKTHGCAGASTEDASGTEWISLPKGLCERLASGSLEPIFEETNANHSHEGHSHEGHKH